MEDKNAEIKKGIKSVLILLSKLLLGVWWIIPIVVLVFLLPSKEKEASISETPLPIIEEQVEEIKEGEMRSIPKLPSIVEDAQAYSDRDIRYIYYFSDEGLVQTIEKYWYSNNLERFPNSIYIDNKYAFEYNENGKMSRVYWENFNEDSNDYDNYLVEQFYYDKNGNIEKYENSGIGTFTVGNHLGETQVSTFNYNADNLLVERIDDFNDYTTRYIYNYNNDVVSKMETYETAKKGDNEEKLISTLYIETDNGSTKFQLYGQDGYKLILVFNEYGLLKSMHENNTDEDGTKTETDAKIKFDSEGNYIEEDYKYYENDRLTYSEIVSSPDFIEPETYKYYEIMGGIMSGTLFHFGQESHNSVNIEDFDEESEDYFFEYYNNGNPKYIVEYESF